MNADMNLYRQNKTTAMNANTIFVERYNNKLEDEEYYEIQNHEKLNVAPRKTMELEGQVVSIRRPTVKLI